MRLVCPRCGAHYEIDDAAIPAAGRDVECSACEHVWRASRPAVPFDPAARPSLSRPLSDDVIAILREEASRELEVRATERQAARAARQSAGAPPGGEAAAEGAPPPERLAPAGGRQAAHGTAQDTLSWAADPADGAERADADLADTDLADTDPADAGPAEGGPAQAAPADADGASADRAGAGPAASAEAAPADRAGAKGAALRDGGGPATAHAEREAFPRMGAAALPADPGPAGPAGAPAPPALVPQPHERAVIPAAPPPRPAATGPVRARDTAAQARRSHDAGYHLAVMAALVALALYAAAPGLADKGGVGAALMRWHAQVDEGRGWLDGRADALLAMLGRR